MYIEYACYDEINPETLKRNAFKAVELGAKGISVPILQAGTFSFPSSLILSCPIDFPYAHGDTDLRIHQTLRAYHYGANAVDIVLSSYLFLLDPPNFKKDVESLVDLCSKKSLTARFMVDYRRLDNTEHFYQILETTRALGAEYVFVSTGLFVDDIDDNILMCNTAQRFYNYRAIVNGNFNSKKQIQTVENSGAYGIRFNNIKAMERCLIGV